MKLFGMLAKELPYFGLFKNNYERFRRICFALTKANKPPSNCSTGDGVSQLPAYSFDPIIADAVHACNKELTRVYFALSSSRVDIDDDKLPFVLLK